MKILYISQSVIPSRTANSIHVMKMCSALSEFKNNKVDLFCLSSNDRQSLKDMHKFYAVKKYFKILRINKINNLFIREIQSLIYIIFIIWRNKYDLIYSRSIQLSFFLSFLGVKTILEIHSPPTKKTSFFLKFLLKKKKRLIKLITINKALKNHIKVNFFCNKSLEILVSPDASDELYLNKKKINKYKIAKNSIGYLGHLYQGRGIDLLIKLAKKLPNNNFYIVGGLDSHVEFWKKKVTSKNIYFLGFKNQDNCNILKQKFDYLIAPYQKKVFVHGSLQKENLKNNSLETSKWMSPLKIFEYMSSKKPIITSNLNSLREILTHNHDAILCKSDNFQEWKNAIERLNKDKKLVKKISDNAHKKFINQYTWKKRAHKIIQRLEKKTEITIFNFSLYGGGTEYMLSTLYNKLSLIQKYKTNLVICQRGGYYSKIIKNKNRLFYLDKNRIISSIFVLYRFLKNTNTNILITSMTHTNVLAILIKKFLIPDLKVIIRESNTNSIKNFYDSSIKSNIVDYLAKKVYRYSDKVIASTFMIKNDLNSNYNVPNNLIYKIQNPFDFKFIDTQLNKSFDTKDIELLEEDYILSIGRLHPQKNFTFLIDIFKYIVSNNEFKNLKLLILGDGKEKLNLQKKINELKLKKNIKLLGFKSNPFIFMKHCKLYISSSLYEGHSNTLIQSQYLNNKILASSANGTNDEVIARNGVIYNNNNPSKIANKAIRLLKQKKKNISKDELIRKFEDKIIIKKIEKLF